MIQEETLMKNVNTTNDCPIALFTTKKFYKKKFKDNICKEGEASSNKHTFGNKKRIKCFHCKNKRHMITDCKIRITIVEEVVAKTSKCC